MKFSLEQVDQVIERTGCTYYKAKEALLYSEGDVLDAIIYVEQEMLAECDEDCDCDFDFEDDFDEVEDGFKKSAKEFADQAKGFGQGVYEGAKGAGQDLMSSLKEIVRVANVSRILFKKEDKVYLDLPITAGAVGLLLFAGPTAVAIVAAIVAGCTLQLVKEDGGVIDINEITKENLDKIKEKFAKDAPCDDCECEEDGECEDDEKCCGGRGRGNGHCWKEEETTEEEHECCGGTMHGVEGHVCCGRGNCSKDDDELDENLDYYAGDIDGELEDAPCAGHGFHGGHHGGHCGKHFPAGSYVDEEGNLVVPGDEPIEKSDGLNPEI